MNTPPWCTAVSYTHLDVYKRQAVRRLIVKDMPLTVILDAHGGDLYQSGPAAYLETK